MADKIVLKKPTVDCPEHHHPLTIQREGNKSFAICDCGEPNNRYFGKVVWEKSLDPAEASKQGDD